MVRSLCFGSPGTKLSKTLIMLYHGASIYCSGRIFLHRTYSLARIRTPFCISSHDNTTKTNLNTGQIQPIGVCDFNKSCVRKYTNLTEGSLNRLKFEEICSETLESLTEYFEELVEEIPHLKSADVTYSDGVLTVQLGKYGTYVINRQSPNLQIWLSSPTSGPKRYDFIDGTWVYKHDNTTLHSLLAKEISIITKTSVDFTSCSHSKINNN